MSLFTGVNIFGVKKGRSPYDQSLAVSTTQSTNASASSSSDRLPIDESYVPSVQPPVIPNYPHFLPSYEDSVAFPVVSVKKYARTSKRDEVKLAETLTERKRLEEQADLYSIIRTTESVEAAYSRDAITESEYTEVCNRLLSQFKTTESALLASGAIKSIEHFMHLYSIDCPRALHRLVVVGVPATVQHSAHDDRGESVLVAETVQAYITAMDALKLDLRAVDEVHPLIAELMSCISRVHLSFDFDGFSKIDAWLKKLNQMRAVESIADDDARQLVFDLESSYNAFHKYLASKSNSSKR